MTSTFVRSRCRFGRRVGSLLWLLGATATVTTWSPLVRASRLGSRSNPTAEEDEAGRSLAGSFGLDAERRALELGGDSRQRALQRLFTLSHRLPGLVAELLDQWLSTEPKLSPVETWSLMRPMAALGGEPRMRKWLIKTFAGESLPVDGKSPYAPLVSEVAALALAKHQSPESTAVLGEWLRRPSDRAHIVQRAVLAHPPRDISGLLDASGPATPLLLETLGELGDGAAVPYLRRVVKRATADVQAAATIALAKLGVEETRDLAALWLSRSDSPHELLAASAFVLFHFGRAERYGAFTRLASVSAPMALALAERVEPDPALLPLAKHLDDLPGSSERERAVQVLGAIGGKAVPVLVSMLEQRVELRWFAARALGEHAPSSAASTVAALLRKPDSRAAAMSALVAMSLRDPAAPRAALRSELEASTKSSRSQERRVAKMGLALLDAERARRFLDSDDPEDLFAAAAASLLHGKAQLQACLRKLEHLSRSEAEGGEHLTPRLRALGSALSFASPDDVISSRLLRALANSDEPIAASARWHLWVRTRASGSEFTVESAPPVQALLAMARQRPPRAAWPNGSYQLLAALSREPDAELRAATVKALRSGSNSHHTSLTFSWLTDYDPSPLVRRRAAAEVTDESVSRPLWVTAPDSTPGGGYWVTVETAGDVPAALYVPGGGDSLLFVRGTRPGQTQGHATLRPSAYGPQSEEPTAPRVQVLPSTPH